MTVREDHLACKPNDLELEDDAVPGSRDAHAVAIYDAMLTSIGERSAEIGEQRLASHWPHVGTAYGGSS